MEQQRDQCNCNRPRRFEFRAHLQGQRQIPAHNIRIQRCLRSGQIYFMATSSEPFGPFTPLKRIFTIDDVYEGHYAFFYLPVAHPEFID